MADTPTHDDLIMPYEGPTTDAAGRACLGVWADQGGLLLTLRREKNGAISIGTNHGEHVTISTFRLKRIADFLVEGNPQ